MVNNRTEQNRRNEGGKTREAKRGVRKTVVRITVLRCDPQDIDNMTVIDHQAT